VSELKPPPFIEAGGGPGGGPDGAEVSPLSELKPGKVCPVDPVELVWNRSRRAWRAMLELAADDEDICIFGSLRGNAGVPRPSQAPSRRPGDMQKSLRDRGECVEKIEMFQW
jgi:hypothetical protein